LNKISVKRRISKIGFLGLNSWWFDDVVCCARSPIL